ncbi:MAG TPA: CHAT domain-containing protein, partial [Calditrichia bacterium]|nr:CHAT domain-containing protein [Calditrichia bacterium]
PLGDYQLQIALNQRLGYNLRYLDRYEEAAPLYRETIAMATAIRQRQDYGPLFLGEGQALYNLKSFHQALSAYDSAAVFFHEDADHDNLARVAGARGDLFKEVGQLDMALRTYDQARLEDPANDRFNMSIDRKIATILKSRGQLDAALDIFRSLLKKDPRSLSRSLTLWHIADIYSRLNRPDSAMANQQAGLKLAREASYSRYVVFHLRSMAEILSNMDRGTEALDTLKVALATAREGGYEEGIMEVQYAFGRIYDKNGDLKNAINAYQEAIRLIEKTVDLLGVEQVKIGYFSDLSQVYLSLAACYVRRYQSRQKSADLDSAFAFIELSRGRTLRDLRQEGHHQSAFKPGDPALQSYRRIETDLQRQQRFLRDYAIRPQAQPEIVDSLERQLTATRYALVASRLKLIQGNAPQKPHFIWPDYQAFRDQLQRSGFAGLIYQISPKATFVLASDGSRSTVIDLPADAVEIDSLVSKLIRPFHQFNASDMGETPFHAEVAHRLYQILIEPVEKAFDLPENLFIVPDIPLMGMPFEMLLDQKQPQSVYTPLEPAEYREDFLQNRYVFVYSPTATLLNPKASAAGRSSKMLIFANPFPETTRLYGQGSRIRSANEWVFEPLAFAEVEATNIRAANENAEIFTREQATEKLFMEIAPEYPIIHIATHGLVDQSFDAFSGLVLAEGDYLLEDGLLMGYELADLQLDCELVTLSACETGRGKEVAG